MRILLFGTGKVYQACKHLFSRHKIVYLLDNDENKQGKYLDGVKIVSPCYGIRADYEAIFILSVAMEEMKAQLLALGVDEGRIYSRREAYACMTKEPVVYGNVSNLVREDHNLLLMLTHNMRTTGAEVVLLESAKVLKKNGFELLVVTLEDGPMRQNFLEAGIPVIIDVRVSVFRLTAIPWIKKFHPQVVFVNTVFMHHLFKCGTLKMPVIWWLHDSEALYQWGQCEGLNDYYHDNIHVYAVSNLAKEPFKLRCPDWPVGLLPYGIESMEKSKSKTKKRGKLVFALIGAIEERKGQDILFEAIDKLPCEDRRECEFWLIYQPIDPTAVDFADKMMKWATSLPEVRMMGQIPHEKMADVYEKISILVCPSRSDTLPTVAAEAMQNGVPCIVSDGTGTAIYIENFKNGFVCPKENAEILAKRMMWCIHNKNKLPAMGRTAFETFQKYFSMEVFEHSLLKAIRVAEV